MKSVWALSVIALTSLATIPASADELWQPPQKKQCALEPNQDCGMDITCPAKTPFVLSGGGGIPKVSDPTNHLAMTMNVAISPNAWRVRWRNMGDKKLDVTVMIRALCTDDGDAWGK